MCQDRLQILHVMSVCSSGFYIYQIPLLCCTELPITGLNTIPDITHMIHDLSCDVIQHQLNTVVLVSDVPIIK